MEVSKSRFKMADGDWVCADSQCGNINFARRNKCNRCNKEKSEGPAKRKLGQEIGKVLAGKSRGLFSADDWQCSKCGNVNWARRQHCNMCNAPKIGEVEERTGFGGGYNDRGVVEYVNREDSDSEYDEFGRRKKRKTDKSSPPRKNDTSPVHKKSKSNDKEGDNEEEEDDEDDEEDGDDDLSKYDLSGWGEDDSKSNDNSKSSSSDQ